MNPARLYFFQSALALVLYALGLAVSIVLYRHNLPPSPWQPLLVLLPTLPLIYFVTVIIRHVASLDEMWRKILTEAMAFSGLATGFTCFSYIFFINLGAPPFKPEWAFYLMWIYYGIGSVWSARRFQ